VWSEKYRPSRVDHLIGNEEARLALAMWLSSWKPGAKAALLMGPPGTGKTTLVNLLAKEHGMNLIDLNASDVRTKERLRSRLGEAMSTVSLFGERSLIFLDEVDGLAGRSDYGAVEFIKDSVKESRNPIVMAANDPDSDEIKKLASSCLAIRFKPPPPRQVEMYLRAVARMERVSIDAEDLRAYARDAAGDVRQAINLLQSNSSGLASHSRGAPAGHGWLERKKEEEKQEEEGGTSSGYYKDTNISVSEAFAGFFGAADKEQAARSLRKLSLTPMEKIREIHRAIVKSGLAPDVMARSLGVVARIDLLMGRMVTSGNWRLLRYLDRQLVEDLYPLVKGAGIKYTGQDDLPFPMLLRIWNDSKKVRELSMRYATKAHTSGMSARSRDLPYVFMLCSSKRFREEIEQSLDLDETYDKFLQKEAGRWR
jgi:replication factor C large subunit